MIITVQKPLSEITEKLENYSTVFIVGCAACATKCQTGSEEAVRQMAEELRKAGKTIAGTAVLDTTCDMRIVKKELGRLQLNDPQTALLILACGAGVQAVEKVLSTAIIIPGLNPVFTGTTERIGIYHEYCALCGDCILDRTGGICPVTRCAKGLVNGPCGGVVNGKCEVDQERDCAWALIYNKLVKAGGEKSILNEYMPPRADPKPRQLNTTKKKETL